MFPEIEIGTGMQVEQAHGIGVVPHIEIIHETIKFMIRAIEGEECLGLGACGRFIATYNLSPYPQGYFFRGFVVYVQCQQVCPVLFQPSLPLSGL